VFAILVAIGIMGEVGFGVRHWVLNRRLQAIQRVEDFNQEQTIAGLNKEAGDARKDAASAMERAAKAEEHLGGARKDAAEATERAAEANKIAEGEKLARMKLEEKLAPRSLEQEQRQRIEAKLKPFPGTPYELGVNPMPEAIRFLEVIDGVLRSSGWINKESEKKDFRFIFTLSNGTKVEQTMVTGVALQFTNTFFVEHKAATEALVLALRGEQVEVRAELLPDSDPSPKAIHVIVGSKQ